MTEESPGARAGATPTAEGDADASAGASTGDDTAPPPGTEQPPSAREDLRHHMLDDLRRGAVGGIAAGTRVGSELGHAAEAMALEIVPTSLSGERVLVGHALGMHLSLHAGGFHGPRETPALLYLFADALAIRPTDDAPMSTVPVFGLHMLIPPLAIARWVYKAGRVEHANLDLVEDAQRFSDSLAQWTVDDFADADPKLQVHRTADVAGPIHVYQHLGFAHVWIPVAEQKAVHLKSGLPASSDAYVKLWQLFALVKWPNGFSTDAPAASPES